MLTYALSTRPGDREYNEDSIRVCNDETVQVFALADGLGGCGHGEIASSVAVEWVQEAFAALDPSEEEFLSDAIESAQQALLEARKNAPERMRMSTTLVLLKISGGYAQWTHVGDSRLYLIRKNRVLYQTLDHSVPQMLVNLGEITPEEIRHHPDRNRLLRTLGSEWEGQPYELSEKVRLKRGDAFLLCSDGFWEYIEEQQMCQLRRQARDVAEWLDSMNALVEKNGQNADMDNYSAICVWV